MYTLFSVWFGKKNNNIERMRDLFSIVNLAFLHLMKKKWFAQIFCCLFAKKKKEKGNEKSKFSVLRAFVRHSFY